MFPNMLKRPALGQVAALGSLYDARSDSFIPLSLLKSPPPESAIVTTQKHSTDVKISKTDTYKDKLDRLGVEAELSASFLAGLVNVEGSGRYLTDKRETNLTMQSSMHYSITTVEQELNLTAKEIKECLAFETLDSDVATHVVTGISWGAQCIISARTEVALSQDRAEIDGALDTKFGFLKVINKSGAVDLTKARGDQEAEHAFDVTVYGDVLSNDGLVPTDFESAQVFISNVHKYVSAANDGKGKPIIYTLMPLSFLSIFRILEIKANIVVHQLSIECLEKFVQLFDAMRDAQQNLHDYHARCQKYISAIPPSHLHLVSNQLSRSRAAEASLKSKYAKLLKEVRSGTADAQQLWQLLEEYRNGESSAEKLQSVITYTEKIEFVELVTREGSQYVGYKGSSIDNLLIRNPHGDAFILYFTDEIRQQAPNWKDHVTLLLELLRDTTQKKLVIVVDCEAIKIPLDRARVSQTRGGQEIVEDVLEQRKVLASNCIMRCNQDAIDRSMTSKPIERRSVKIPCPQSYCDRTLVCTWICAKCQSLVEYGYVDDRLYCDCGSCQFDQWEFKCNDARHGSSWGRYDNDILLQLLKALRPFKELNILILGETGVGKSTWINAFINYLTYDSLQEALGAEDLRWVIPCSFTTQIKDESDRKGRLVTKKVKIGSNKTENDGSTGKSATQCTSVYAVNIDNTRVRLIDTPGIGDTGGVEQDNKNMVDILRVLRTYNHLHGILILLKPNAPRLTVMFRFCVKQLFTHLHRNASNNVAFGFTNTRGSNYKPGDTFTPLETLLREYKEVQMGLFNHNVYCFDSESFRYLAARKQGVDMGLLDDNTRSWEYSVTECKRLVKHFQGLEPHQVRSTINLNETRNIILRLTEPMALIAQKIQSSITVNEDNILKLRTQKLNRKQLEQSLYVQKESLESHPVDQPRTVCTNHSCVEVRGDFEGRNEMTIIYKTMCHKPCGLGGWVKRDHKGDSELQNCAAMGPGGVCKRCSHSWMDHMHIYYDYRPMTYKYVDEAVNRDLIQNATDIQLQEQAIKMKQTAIEEFKLEHREVQEAAIQFGFFLKRHAITPYNDATLEYVDHLIDQEKIKIHSGGEKAALEKLKVYRAEHVEKVKILTKAMERGDTNEVLGDQGVRQLIDGLYGLPHFGEDLKKIVATNEKAAEATFREKSFNVSAGTHWNKPAYRKSCSTNRRNHNQHASPASYGSSFANSGQRSFPGSIPGEFPGAFQDVNQDGSQIPIHSNQTEYTNSHPSDRDPDRRQNATKKRFFDPLYEGIDTVKSFISSRM
jgi:hypothetical protein